MNPFARRLLLFCGIYLLLFGLFRLDFLENASAQGFSKGAGGVLSLFLPKGYFHVEKISATGGEPCTIRVLYGNKTQTEAQLNAAKWSGKSGATLKLQEFRVKYPEFFLFPAIFFLSLVLITPLAARVLWKNAALGLLIFCFFCFLKLLCYALYHFSQSGLGVYELTGQPARFVEAVYGLKIGVSFLMAVLIWLLVTFRRENWREVLGNLSE